MAVSVFPFCGPHGPPHRLSGLVGRICLPDLRTALHPDIHHRMGIHLCVTPWLITRTDWCRNVDLLPIGYAFRPRLRIRLTLSGLAFLRNPWVFGVRVSHPHCRYSCRHHHFHAVHHAFRHDFSPHGTLPYRCSSPQTATTRSFGAWLESRELSARIHLTGELLRTLSRNGCF